MKNGLLIKLKTESGELASYSFDSHDLERCIDAYQDETGEMVDRIISVQPYTTAVCSRCEGDGSMPPCCSGSRRNINCGCYGERQICPDCLGLGYRFIFDKLILSEL